MTSTVKKINDVEVEIEGEISADVFEKHRNAAIQKISSEITIDGFRKGHIPEKILIERVGEITILEAMAERALEEAYPTIILEHAIDAIGRPTISLTKIAAKNPLGFKIKQAILPKITLPDYKKIAASVGKEFTGKTIEVLGEEIENILTRLRTERKKDPKDETEIAPALDDAFVQTLGDFKTVDDLKTKIGENLKFEKTIQERDKKRSKIVESLIEKTKITLPDVLVDREAHALVHELQSNIAQLGISFEDYLKQAKKTETDLIKESRPQAEKRVAMGLILDEIAKQEKIVISPEELETETQKVIAMYQGADAGAARNYVEGILKNERVFKLLEETTTSKE